MNISRLPHHAQHSAQKLLADVSIQFNISISAYSHARLLRSIQGLGCVADSYK